MRHDTLFPADTVEFCPIPGYESLFVCGTYKLIEKGNGGGTFSVEDSVDEKNESAAGEASTSSSRKRVGECTLLKLDEDGDGDAL